MFAMEAPAVPLSWDAISPDMAWPRDRQDEGCAILCLFPTSSLTGITSALGYDHC